MNLLFSCTLIGMLFVTNANAAEASASAYAPGVDEPFSLTGNWCDGTYALAADFGTADGTWSWTKDGILITGANSNQLNLTDLGTGVYTASWQSGDGSSAMLATYDLKTLPGPKSHFVSLNNPPIGATKFADNSKAGDAPIVSWHWNFGDGTTSTEQNPEHFYAGWGPRIFTVVLTTTDSNGCTNSWTSLVEWK
jgi:PKD repeat protein